MNNMKNLFHCILFILCLRLGQSNICTVCNCFFVNVKSVDSDPRENEQIIAFNYRLEVLKLFIADMTNEFVDKYFYVDCSNHRNVGEINNLEWPKVEILGIFGNFKSSKWKKLEFFPPSIKKQIVVLSFSTNLISKVEPFELEDFTNLKMLNLSQNQIDFIKKSTFAKLNSLKILDLSENAIAKIDDWAFYGTMLEYLNLSKNLLTHVTSDIFRGLNSLSLLDLSQNHLIKLPDDFGNLLPSLATLSLKENTLNSVPELPKELKKLDLSSNNLSEFPFSHSNLETLDIRNNQLLSLKNLHIPQLKVLRVAKNNLTKKVNLDSSKVIILDLSYNQYNAIPVDLFSDKFASLEKLYLDGNSIVNVSFPAQSKPFQNLRLISLSSCLIKSLPKNAFQGIFPKDEFNCFNEIGITLNFSHNSIKNVNEEIFEDFAICSIDLSNNNLKTLSSTVLPWRKMSHINLQRNPWHCDCNIQWMLDEFMIYMYTHYPRLLFDLRCATPQKFKQKIFVFWYNKTQNVFCSSGIYFELTENKTIELWTASAIACIVLVCLIVLIIVAILILLYTKPKLKKNQNKPRNKKITHYKPIQGNGANERREL